MAELGSCVRQFGFDSALPLRCAFFLCMLLSDPWAQGYLTTTAPLPTRRHSQAQLQWRAAWEVGRLGAGSGRHRLGLGLPWSPELIWRGRQHLHWCFLSQIPVPIFLLRCVHPDFPVSLNSWVAVPCRNGWVWPSSASQETPAVPSR